MVKGRLLGGRRGEEEGRRRVQVDTGASAASAPFLIRISAAHALAHSRPSRAHLLPSFLCYSPGTCQ